MFIDALLRVSAAQAVTASALSTNSIDLGAPTVKRQVGTGKQLGFAISVTVAADHTTGDETYEFDIVQSANPDLSAADIIAKYPYTDVQAAASLGAGGLAFLPIPPGFPTKQYIGISYVTAGTTPSITVNADLMPESDFALLDPAYKSGFVIS